MAVFLINICKFNGCGITFPSLGDLIQHIEDTHIDYDPQVIEQKEQSQPSCLPLSYVLRFITDAARKEGPFLGTSGAELKRKLAIKHHSYSMSSSNRSNTPTDIGSEMDEDEMMMVSESEDSNDSWTTEEFSSEFIMRYGSRHSGSLGNNSSNEKPFACPVPGCKKRYKNVNGIKYHSKNGHKKDGKVRKGYKCHCGKSYKTSQGLKSHSLSAHNSSTNDAVTTVSTATVSCMSQSGSLSPSSVSNISGCSSLNQSQLSPNSSNSISTSTHQIATNNNNNNNNNHNNNNCNSNNNNSNNIVGSIVGNNNNNYGNNGGGTNNSGNAIKNNFGLISLKAANKQQPTVPSASLSLSSSSSSSSSSCSSTSSSSSSLSTTSTQASTTINNNTNKLVKLLPDAGNDNKMIDGCGGSGIGNGGNGGIKMNLPSLVNLGILTPATSPKQQQMQQLNQNHNNNHNSVMCNNSNTNSNSSNNNDPLPLTPISPNMNRNIHFNNNNNNNNNNAGADNITTDET